VGPSEKPQAGPRLALRIGLVALVIFITLPWSSQAAVLASHWIQCGQAPVVGDNYAAADEYYLPSDFGYLGHALAIIPFIRPSDYWCTEKEAEYSYHHAINPSSWI
jgi:hypothetical protein